MADLGRPTKLTPQVQKTITDLLRLGNYFDTACQAAGIGERTGYDWLERGNAEIERRKKPNVKPGTKTWDTEQKYVDFSQSVEKASSDAEMLALSELRTGKKIVDKLTYKVEDWQRIAWFLERRYPRKWGRMQRLDITSKDEKIKGYVGISPDDWDGDDD